MRLHGLVRRGLTAFRRVHLRGAGGAHSAVHRRGGAGQAWRTQSRRRRKCGDQRQSCRAQQHRPKRWTSRGAHPGSLELSQISWNFQKGQKNCFRGKVPGSNTCFLLTSRSRTAWAIVARRREAELVISVRATIAPNICIVEAANGLHIIRRRARAHSGPGARERRARKGARSDLLARGQLHAPARPTLRVLQS